MLVEPTSGASTHAVTASRPNPASVHARRPRTSSRPSGRSTASVTAGNGHDREMARAWMELDVSVRSYRRADVVGGERVAGRAAGKDAPILQQHDLWPQRSGQVQIVGRSNQVGAAALVHS